MPSLNMEWLKDANCKTVSVKTFFPDVDTRKSEYNKKIREAKQICEACKVRLECLEYAVEYEPLGIWGGLSEKERHHWRRINNVNIQKSFVSGVRSVAR